MESISSSDILVNARFHFPVVVKNWCQKKFLKIFHPDFPHYLRHPTPLLLQTPTLSHIKTLSTDTKT